MQKRARIECCARLCGCGVGALRGGGTGPGNNTIRSVGVSPPSEETVRRSVSVRVGAVVGRSVRGHGVRGGGVRGGVRGDVRGGVRGGVRCYVRSGERSRVRGRVRRCDERGVQAAFASVGGGGGGGSGLGRRRFSFFGCGGEANDRGEHGEQYLKIPDAY